MERDGTEYSGCGAFFLSLPLKQLSLFMAKQAISNQLKELSVAMLQEKIGKRIYMSALRYGQAWGGTYFLMACAPQNALLTSKDFSHSKNGWFNSFFQNFHKLGPIFKGFSTSKLADFTILFKIFCKMRPVSKDFLWN